jgi:hypothetical protein
MVLFIFKLKGKAIIRKDCKDDKDCEDGGNSQLFYQSLAQKTLISKWLSSITQMSSSGVADHVQVDYQALVKCVNRPARNGAYLGPKFSAYINRTTPSC